MIENKIIGIILLVLGLLMVGWSILYTYNIIQGKTDLPEFFFSQEVEEISPQSNEIEETVREQIENILPQSSVYRLLNLIVWAIFAWIVILAGGKISSLGIGMLK